MSNPRFRPRDFTTEPHRFGKGQGIAWIEQDEHEAQVRLKAAKLQHLYAIRIRRRIKETGSSLKDYAAASDTKYDRVVKMLRGDTVLRLEDLAVADIVLGEISEFAIYEAAAASARKP